VKRFFFLGERPSQKALDMNVRWEHGRLAAKQLFDALEACGIEPSRCRFGNVFLTNLERSPTRKPWLRRTIRRAVSRGETIVALGRLASSVLAGLNVEHVAVVHPAARGRIRKKERYAAHIREKLA
jgi:hypothetical protein